ncbi:hypothetical protein LINPERPRIM_LOCUS32189 [Linum perenne]
MFSIPPFPNPLPSSLLNFVMFNVLFIHHCSFYVLFTSDSCYICIHRNSLGVKVSIFVDFNLSHSFRLEQRGFWNEKKIDL